MEGIISIANSSTTMWSKPTVNKPPKLFAWAKESWRSEKRDEMRNEQKEADSVVTINLINLEM